MTSTDEPTAGVFGIRRVAVLGAGTMGAQIAALAAGFDIPVDLLDLPGEEDRNAPAEAGKRRLLDISPSPLYEKAVLDRIRTGNIGDHLDRLGEADWVVEAVFERIDVKQEIWRKVAGYLKPTVIATTNTSGIPIASIAEALGPDLRRRFAGTHFFNPPRYLHLLEIIPTPDTDLGVLATLRSFAETVLGKGVVIANDVPNFTANRIGAYSLTTTLRAMEELGLAFDDVDAATGPVIGRPSSATFRLLDVVGIDVFAQVCDNTVGFVSEPWEKEAYRFPDYVREMLERGWSGEKGGQGFYKRIRKDGATQILVLDPASMEYRPRSRPTAASLNAARVEPNLGKRLRDLVNADDWAGRFTWRVLSQVLPYAASKLGEVAEDIINIDRGLHWGFGWELGPFQLWDALGVSETVPRMKADGIDVPAWVERLAEQNGTFYHSEGGRLMQATAAGSYIPLPLDERTVSTAGLEEAGKRRAGNAGASLYDLGDGVALLDLHSPNQAIGYEMVATLEAAVETAPRDFQALVIGSHLTPNFCVGANVKLILDPANAGEWSRIDDLVRRFQYVLLALRRLSVPVVVAPFGATLGGGAEIVFGGHRAAASVEIYMGLVEVGAGLVPGGGGCMELLARATAARPDDHAGAAMDAFQTIGFSKTSGSALEARSIGFLRADDVIVANSDHLVYQGKREALRLAESGFTPPPPRRIPVLGPGARGKMVEAAEAMVSAGHATEHDLEIVKRLAFILTGGAAEPGATESEEHFLELERAALIELCHYEKSRARMQSILDTGRPLRN